MAALRKKYGCPVAYFSGAVGGLMTPPDGRYRDADNRPLADETYEYSDRYGQEVAEVAGRAMDAATPIQLDADPRSRPKPWPCRWTILFINWPAAWACSAAAACSGRATASSWAAVARHPARRGQRLAVETEVACLRLGELYVACIPGEIYPELVYGQYPAAAEAGVDFPDAPLEPSVAQIMRGRPWMLLGLANDEIGYIIPKRQWDQRPRTLMAAHKANTAR